MEKELVAMLLAGGKGTRLETLTKKLRNLLLVLVENIALLIFLYPIVPIVESIRLVFSPNMNRFY